WRCRTWPRSRRCWSVSARFARQRSSQSPIRDRIDRMVFITRSTGFSAAHRYYLPELSDEENARLYGACARPNGHGHDYSVDVTIRGDTDPRTGLVVNIAELKPILQDEVSEPLDREFLTIVHPVCRGHVPTCENLSTLLWN